MRDIRVGLRDIRGSDIYRQKNKRHGLMAPVASRRVSVCEAVRIQVRNHSELDARHEILHRSWAMQSQALACARAVHKRCACAAKKTRWQKEGGNRKRARTDKGQERKEGRDRKRARDI